MVDNLKKERDIIIGANIGKNYFTQNSDAHSDYLKCLSELNEFVDYFAINISSPNTEGLRDLHDKSLLKPFLEKLVKFNNKLMNKRPLLLKISPDLNEEQIADIVILIKDLKLDGIIATNRQLLIKVTKAFISFNISQSLVYYFNNILNIIFLNHFYSSMHIS